jgi:hypothetical protein
MSGTVPKSPDLATATEASTTDLAWSVLPEPDGDDANRQRYLNLMKLSLSDLLYENDPEQRKSSVEGWGWPGRAVSMIGLRRLNNLEACFAHVLQNGVGGDLIETGVWRGGAVIFMRALLAAHGVADRKVWVADSFEGMPVPNVEQYPADRELDLSAEKRLCVSADEVRRNFRRYGLLDERVRFLEGWFSETLPTAPIEQLAILRLDGDLYESTTDALSNLYPKVSQGGCVIIDDNWVPACRQAVDDYRAAHGVEGEIMPIDTQSAFWIKEEGGA